MCTRLFILGLLICGLVSAQVDVLTANYDNHRTNATLSEGILDTANVNPAQFGRLYAFPVDGQVYAQPLYVHGLTTTVKAAQLTMNVLYVATMHNSVYAFDADASTGTSPIWHVNFGPTVNPHDFDVPTVPYDDIQKEIGILSTPVIDRSTNTLYVVNETRQSNADAFFLHALDLMTGVEKFNGPVQIQATVTGAGWAGDSTNGQLPFHPEDHLQRPGLLLNNGSVWAGFGSHGDVAPWHGWLFGYNAANLQQQTGVFNTSPDHAAGAIWQGGRGLAADANGDIYFSTGNGNYDGNRAWSMSLLHVTTQGNPGVVDWFTPSEWDTLNQGDNDFGSNGPILVPGTNFLIAGGKEGVVVLMDRTQMGHEVASNTQIIQSFAATDGGGSIFNTALWTSPDGPILYVWGYSDPLRAYELKNGKFDTSGLAVNSSAQNALPFSGMTVSSNGFVPGTGIFWATTSATGTLPAAGTLHAFDALNIAHELWNSNLNGARDTLGNFTKFANPTVVGGKVFVPTDSNQVQVYGLLPVPGVDTVVNSASFQSSTVAPGELVTIFGNSIGPAAPVGAVLTGGSLATSLGALQVTFDGKPAPLLFGSFGQVNAIVPFSVAGQSTQMQVIAPNGQTYSLTLAVGAIAPAMFTRDASGSGQGAIINDADMSRNTATNPAARGSSISLYATGAGPFTPSITDGLIVSPANPPRLSLPVTVTIGGQPATVTYQGAAPGLAAGVAQINVQIPSNLSPGPAALVTLMVGTTSAQNTVTVAVK